MSSFLIGVVLMLYSASLSLGYLPSGRLSDRVGRRPLIVAGTSLLAVGILWLSLSSRVETTVLAVILSGMGLALLVPAGNALISEVVSGRGSGSVFAIYQIATLAASVVGSFVAGLLVEDMGFSKLFLLSAIITGAAAVLAFVMVPETLERKVAGYASAVRESLHSSGKGTVMMLRTNKNLALLAGALVIHSIGVSMINPFVPIFAEKAIRLDIFQVGMILSVENAGTAIAQLPSGHLTDRHGAKPLLLAHFVLSSLCWIFYTLSPNFEVGVVVMLLYGVVTALDMPARRTIMIEYATAEAGKATIIGSLDAISGTVGIIGPLIGGIALAQMGYAAPFLLASVVNAFACVPLLTIMRARERGSIPSLVKAAPN
jgi:MFS family permease